MVDPISIVSQLFSPPELTALVLVSAIASAVAIRAPKSYGMIVSLGIIGAGSTTILFYMIFTRG
jgi:hypothetical protein